MLLGFVSRLQRELPECEFIIPENRIFCVWNAGSKMASSLSPDKWISIAEYDEHGPAFYRKKCVAG